MAKTLLDVHRTRNRGARSGPAVTVDAGRDQLRLHDLEFSTSVIGVRASHAGARARPSVFSVPYNAAHHARAPGWSRLGYTDRAARAARADARTRHTERCRAHVWTS